MTVTTQQAVYYNGRPRRRNNDKQSPAAYINTMERHILEMQHEALHYNQTTQQ